MIGWCVASAMASGIWAADGDAPGRRLGTALVSVGDLDRDRVPDVAVGGEGSAGSGVLGVVEVRSGADGALLWSAEGDLPGDGFGATIAGPGDLTGDGVPDVVVGASAAGAGGRIVLLDGASGGVAATLDGAAAQGRFGASLATVGDLDRDGFRELAVGAPAAGTVVVVDGATFRAARTLSDPTGAGSFGAAVAPAGDLDADGVPDVLVGASGSGLPGATPGEVTAWSGATGAALRKFPSTDPLEAFGAAVDGAVDLDADGVPDLLVGAPRADGERGRVALLSGATGAVVWEGWGEAPLDHYGSAAAFAGDLDGDGGVDLAVGAPLRDGDAGTDQGKVYTYDGGSRNLLGATDGGVELGLLGSALAEAGDVDRDGFDDLLVGASGADAAQPGAGTGRAAIAAGARSFPLVAHLVGPGQLLLKVEGTWPGTNVAFAASAGQGPTELKRLGGTALLDAPLVPLGQVPTGPGGSASLQIALPPLPPGTTFAVQAATRRYGATVWSEGVVVVLP